MMTFKEKLVVLRKIKHLTQDEFASAVGVSRQAVYKWESGQSYPEVQKLIEMKLLFGISIDDLLDDTFEIELPKKKRKRRSKKADADAEAAQVTETPIAKEEVEVVKETPAPAPKEEKKPEPKEEVKPTEAPAKEAATKADVTESKAAPAPKAAETASAERKPPERTSLFERLFGNKK